MQGTAAGSWLCVQSKALGQRGKWGPDQVTERPSLPPELRLHWQEESPGQGQQEVGKTSGTPFEILSENFQAPSLLIPFVRLAF